MPKHGWPALAAIVLPMLAGPLASRRLAPPTWAADVGRRRGPPTWAAGAFARDGGLLDTIGRRYVASQGCRLGRAGRIRVEVDGHGVVRLGGNCVTCVDGVLSL